jgi:long-chain acyl-CoA synthetase
MLRQAVMEQPDRAGTVYRDRQRTWREIADRVPRLAAAPRQLGVRPDQHPAVLRDPFWVGHSRKI